MNNLIWQAFVDSGLVGKSIYISLLFASIWVWTIAIHKYYLLKWVHQGMDAFFRQFENAKTGKFSLSPSPAAPNVDLAWTVYQRGCQELSKHRASADGPLLPGALEKIKISMEEVARQKIGNLEKYLIFLATAAAAGPLFGIMGTLWGVLLAFRKMGQVGAATLDAVAPGISEALLTTVVGLAIAIPALLVYNYFNHAISKITARMDTFISEFLAAVEEQRAPAPEAAASPEATSPARPRARRRVAVPSAALSPVPPRLKENKEERHF